MSPITRAIKSAFWLFAESWLSAVFSILSFAILARLLGPEVFGTMALAGVIFGATAIFVGSALTESLEQREEIDQSHIDTIFWLNSGLCLIFAILITLLAGVFGGLLNSTSLAVVLPALSLTAFISGLGAIPQALLERDLSHDKLVKLNMLSGSLATTTAIVLAWFGFGVWSLVFSALIGASIGTVGAWYLTQWRPTLLVSRAAFDDLFEFNRDTIATNVLGYVDSAFPRILLSIVGGERALGLLDIAFKFSGMVSELLMGPFNELAMNVVARLQSSRKAVADLLDRVFIMMTALIYPATLGLCAIAPILVPFILGSEWSGAVLPVQIALLMGIRDATGDFNFAILRGMGDTRSPLVILAIGILIMVAFAPLFAPYGATGICALIALRVFSTWPISAYRVQNVCGFPALKQFTIGWRALLSAMISAGSVIGASLLLPASLNSVVALGGLIALGMIVFALMMWLIGATHIQRLFAALKWFRHKYRSPIEMAA